MKKSLIGKNLDEFSDLCLELGVENFRSKQLFNWIYRNEANDLTELKNDQTNIDLFISDNKSKYGALNLNEDENSTLTLLTNYDAYDKNAA